MRKIEKTGEKFRIGLHNKFLKLITILLYYLELLILFEIIIQIQICLTERYRNLTASNIAFDL